MVARRIRRQQPEYRIPAVRPAGPPQARLVPGVGDQSVRVGAGRGRRHHHPLLRQLPAAVSRCVPGIFGSGRGRLRPRPRIPVPLRGIRAVSGVGGGDPARADRRHGHQGGAHLPRLRAGRPAGADHPHHDHRFLSPATERHPATRRKRRAQRPHRSAHLSGGHRVHLLRPLFPGLLRTGASPAQPVRQTLHRQQLCATRLGRGRRPAGRQARRVARRFLCAVDQFGAARRRGGRDGVTWRDNSSGAEYTEDARVVVLAAGSTESPRLWLNSGLPNPNDWVGRGHTDHFLDWVVGSFDEDTGNSRGANSSARIDFPGRGGIENVGLTPAIQAFSMCLSDSGVRGVYDNGRGPRGAWDGPAGRLVGTELTDLLSDGIDHLLNFLILTDDHVQARNRISLSLFPADENGAPAKVDVTRRQRTPRTLENREFLANRGAEIMRAAGAKKVYRMDWAPLLLHVHSSMRMGASPANSVLDGDAQARWVKRLFVADNSALPNSLGGPNPTLSTQALATRTAEKIFAAYFGGDSWVDKEAPIVTTDHRISARLTELGL
ncbi:GMC oxidoreductase [Nocardia blacklockiae]|uniref:GMC oxidoreductase n=1 Tax=Nocardia blacklockiae TaxID=480036 RepID=UPI002B4B3579|nr:GMC oxidoreductase [Nocardia blacklockiae]